jgi:tRNA A-37 threonylcarbamoyl transferase component Bud32
MNHAVFQNQPWPTLVLGGARVLLLPEFDDPAVRALLADIELRAAAPAANVLHAGRNRTVQLEVTLAAGRPLAVVVKSFGAQGRLKDWNDARRGTKAERSFRVAARLHAAGVGTPAPVACIERWSGRRLLASHFVSVFAPGLTCFRDELIRLYRADPVCSKLIGLLQTVADAVRAMHRAGVQHNDLGNQNIMLRRTGDATWADVQFVDLNRARLRAALSLRDVARDLSRITLPSDFLRVFFEMYFEAPPPAEFLRWERHYRRRFAGHTLTRRWRHPLRERGAPAGDPATTYPDPKDIWIWDERSAQAISTLVSRDRNKLHTAANSMHIAGAVAGGALPVWNQYRALRDRLYAAPVDFAGCFGLAVEPRPASFALESRWLADLGKIPVLVRFYHHAAPEQRAFAALAARQLAAAGHPLAIALVQDRRAVLEPARWRDFVAQTLDQVGAVAEWAEVGHAINRVKWGLWELRDYLQLLAPVQELRGKFPQVRWMGPAVIDFEYHQLLAVLKLLPPDFRFDALSHHLYVDRRGAPENYQGKFSAAEKFALARAIAACSPAVAPRLIISETNWPLAGTGVWSPVGSPYESPGPRCNDPSVSEQDYADYMLRYLVIALASGMVERVYWWRLAARGFGLLDDTAADPAAWRLRPAYHQFRVFLRRCETATFLERRVQPDGARYFLFRAADGACFAFAYAHPAPAAFHPPFTCGEVRDALDQPIPRPAQLTGSPLYLLEVVR